MPGGLTAPSVPSVAVTVAADGARPISPHPAEPLLIAGPVTWDVIDGQSVPGGAVSYAARVAAAFGIRAQVLVNAAPDADLSALEGHDVHLVQSPATLTFEHQFDADGARTLVLRDAAGRSLEPADLPARWPPATTLVLCPLLPGDLDAPAFVRDSAAEEIVLLAQGLQRRVAPDGRVEFPEEPSPALLAAADPRVSAFLASEETAAWPVSVTDDLVSSLRRLIVTHGRSGSTIHADDAALHIPARLTEQIDSTGAGDVFAVAFILALRSGDGDVSDEEAGRLAAAYAAANIAQRGAAPLPPLRDIQAQLAEGPSATAAAGASGAGEPS